MYKYQLTYLDRGCLFKDIGLVEGSKEQATALIMNCFIDTTEYTFQDLKLTEAPSVLIKNRVLELMAASSNGSERGL